jgi:hypothetical protein
LAEAAPPPVEQSTVLSGNGGSPASLRLTTIRWSESAMTHHKTDEDGKQASAPPTVEGAPPERELELKLKKHPEDLDAKADVGSDESMDASDPSAATQPGGNEPAPSSGFPKK